MYSRSHGFSVVGHTPDPHSVRTIGHLLVSLGLNTVAGAYMGLAAACRQAHQQAKRRAAIGFCACAELLRPAVGVYAG